MRRTVLIIVVLCITGIMCSVFTHKGRAGEAKDTVVAEINISKKLRRVLSAEMNSVQQAITGLSIAIPAGKWNEIAETAGKMNNGYIMKKRLSKGEMAEFNRAVSEDYQSIDREFHEMTDQLMKAAKSRRGEQVNFYFYRLTETCIQCHAQYAKKRFPDFKR